MAMALLSAAPPNHLPNITLTQSNAKHCAILKPYFSFRLKKQQLKYQRLASTTRAISDNEYGVGSDGSPPPAAVAPETKFQDLKWVGGTWDLNQFLKNGKTDWDDVIDAGDSSLSLLHTDTHILFLALTICTK
ncbi:Uncharacterized protein Adt_10274 [Abeliophyllum distichum]|uniref:Uncharacterized protein n=1 Tax=Abeliophyllum distichum TaxID=126358 RepID=A0ABD1UJR6_9LAMI